MSDNFIKIIDYLETLQTELNDDKMSNEEQLLTIIKHALLSDNYYQGSIILTKDNNQYKVSSIQKHSYGWLLQDRVIDIDYIIDKLTELNIEYKLEHYEISNHKSDYELSFSIPKLRKKLKRNK